MIREMPKRLSPPAPPGALLKQISAAAPRPAGAEPRGGDSPDQPSYRAEIQRLPCLYCGLEPSEAAHVRYASAAFGKASGLQKKPHDKFCVPLCAEDHRLARHAQHNRNEEAFWIGIGINPLLVAEQLWAQRFDFVAMRAVTIAAIANRTKSG